jgi:hypothetical protein
MIQPAGKLATGTQVLQFFNPFSSGKSLPARVVNLAFYVFAGVMALHWYRSWTRGGQLRGRTALNPAPAANAPRREVRTISARPYTATEILAISLALRASAEMDPTVFRIKEPATQEFRPFKYQPLDERIKRLGAQETKITRELTAAFASGQNTLELEKQLVNCLFTISTLILDEYPLWRTKFATEHNALISFPEILLRPFEFYQKLLFTEFVSHYHYLRSGCVLGLSKGKVAFVRGSFAAERFYREGTEEYKIRELFNALCERVEHFIDLSEVSDKYKALWVAYRDKYLQPDTSFATYRSPLAGAHSGA